MFFDNFRMIEEGINLPSKKTILGGLSTCERDFTSKKFINDNYTHLESMVVSYMDMQPAAYAEAYSYGNCDSVYITCATHNNFRRRKLAQSAIRCLMNKLADLKFKKVYFLISKENIAGLELAEKLGFRIVESNDSTNKYLWYLN